MSNLNINTVLLGFLFFFLLQLGIMSSEGMQQKVERGASAADILTVMMGTAVFGHCFSKVDFLLKQQQHKFLFSIISR